MEPSRRFRLGRLTVDPSARRICAGGKDVPLQPKIHDLLVYLAQRPGQAVSHAQLLEAVWGRTVASDTVITVAVRKLRQVLSEFGALPSALVTLRGVGYRLDAPVEWLDEDNIADPSLRRPRWPRWQALLGAAILAGAVMSWHFLQSPVPSMPRIAVLELDNATGNAELDWATTGVTALIGEQLRRRGVDVVSLQLMRQLQDELSGQSIDLAVGAIGVDEVFVPRLLPTLDGYRLELISLTHADAKALSLAGNDPASLSLGMAVLLADKLRAPLPVPAAAGGLDQPFLNEAYARAFHYRFNGELQAARELYELVLRESPDHHWARYQLALVLQQMGHRDQTDALLAVLETTPLADPELEASVKLSIGNQHWYAGDLDIARAYYLEARDIYRLNQIQHGLPLILGSLALLATTSADHELASGYLMEVLDLARQQRNRVHEARALHNLGNGYMLRGLYPQAREALDQAYTIRIDMGARRQAANTLGVLAELALRQGRLSESIELLERVLEDYDGIGDQRGRGMTLSVLAASAWRQGDYRRARELALDAATLARMLNDASGMAHTAHVLGRSLQAMGDWLGAEHQYQEAAAGWSRLGNLVAELEVRADQIRLAIDRGDVERADRLLQEMGSATVGLADARTARIYRALALRARMAQGDLDGIEPAVEALLTGVDELALEHGDLVVEIAQALYKVKPDDALLARLMPSVTAWAPRDYAAARLSWQTAADAVGCESARNALQGLRQDQWQAGLPKSPSCSAAD